MTTKDISWKCEYTHYLLRWYPEILSIWWQQRIFHGDVSRLIMYLVLLHDMPDLIQYTSHSIHFHKKYVFHKLWYTTTWKSFLKWTTQLKQSCDFYSVHFHNRSVTQYSRVMKLSQKQKLATIFFNVSSTAQKSDLPVTYCQKKNLFKTKMHKKPSTQILYLSIEQN